MIWNPIALMHYLIFSIWYYMFTERKNFLRVLFSIFLQNHSSKLPKLVWMFQSPQKSKIRWQIYSLFRVPKLLVTIFTLKITEMAPFLGNIINHYALIFIPPHHTAELTPQHMLHSPSTAGRMNCFIFLQQITVQQPEWYFFIIQ